MEDTGDNFARAIASDKLLVIYGVWKELRGGRIGPRRSELTPSHLRRATPWAFTVDLIGDDFRFGFAGDRLMQFLETRCATPNLSGLREIAFFAAAEKLFRRCVETRKPLVSGPKPTFYRGKEHLERQVLLLPLSDDGLDVTGLLGAFDTWQLGTNRHTVSPLLAD
ncbi:MAG TPA: PAS domain-containing protein [Rhizomicrobium sp.]|nr:PAS domain-containing protein [Rhizomicrobium sp.]